MKTNLFFRFFAMSALLGISLAQTSLAGSEAQAIERMKARAAQVVQAKDAGKIGERPDGLLGAVKSDLDGGTNKLLQEENADRQSVYQSRASEQGQSLDVFMRVMGDSRVDQEKAGRFIQKADGSWQKKK